MALEDGNKSMKQGWAEMLQRFEKLERNMWAGMLGTLGGRGGSSETTRSSKAEQVDKLAWRGWSPLGEAASTKLLPEEARCSKKDCRSWREETLGSRVNGCLRMCRNINYYGGQEAISSGRNSKSWRRSGSYVHSSSTSIYAPYAH